MCHLMTVSFQVKYYIFNRSQFKFLTTLGRPAAAHFHSCDDHLRSIIYPESYPVLPHSTEASIQIYSCFNLSTWNSEYPPRQIQK